MVRRVLAVAAAALFTVAVTACAPSPVALPSALSSIEATDGSAAMLCPDAPLRGPDGSVVNLTGTWRGFATGLLFVTQTRSCVAILGLSNFPDQPLGTNWRSVFVGDLTAEFTVVGRWTWINSVLTEFGGAGATNVTTVQIAFDDQGEEVIQLAPEELVVDPTQEHPLVTLERITQSTGYPN